MKFLWAAKRRGIMNKNGFVVDNYNRLIIHVDDVDLFMLYGIMLGMNFFDYMKRIKNNGVT
ncbi:MAG: hypothetical protein EOL95_11710 [Bacteroidia bacterium]|nr:hypothetical protein [Bacteroidia bacterium]